MSRRPYIKLCGLTSPADVRAAALAGADLIGINFHPESPRAVSFGLGARLVEAMHAAPRPRGARRLRSVAVFVDPDAALVQDVLEHVGPDVLQFHGDESPAFCQSFKRPFLKAFRLRTHGDAEAIPDYLGGYAVGYLVDAWSAVAHGGTGRRISLPLAERALRHPKGFLAGGLTPDNVGELVRALHPYGVDVASGIEIRPGIKSAELMGAFVRAVAEATGA